MTPETNPAENRLLQNPFTPLAELVGIEDVAVVMIDSLGFVRVVNGEFCRLMRCRPDEVIGQSLSRIVPRELADSHEIGLSRIVRTGPPSILGQPLLVPVRAWDGQEFQAEICVYGERSAARAGMEGGGWCFGATIQPV